MAISAGLAVAALAGCGKSGPPAGGTPSSSTAASTAVPTTQAAAAAAMNVSVDTASSYQVTGAYYWPHDRVAVDVGVLISGDVTGSVNDSGFPMSGSYVAGKMYYFVTPLFLAYEEGDTSRCATLCGKYVTGEQAYASSMMQSIGFNSTETFLQGMAIAGKPMTKLTYDGQHAYRWPLSTKGSYIIVAANAQCVPLKVDVPGQFVLTFSQWNKVPAPVAPAASDIEPFKWYTGS